MLKMLGALFRADPPHSPAGVFEADVAPEAHVTLDSGESFPIRAHLAFVNGIPAPDWNAVWAWVESLDGHALRNQAWTACERNWLGHVAQALGSNYRLAENGSAMLVSTQDNRAATVTLNYMSKTLQRIVRVLEGVALVPEMGKDLLILFEDADAYYKYVARYYPDEGEFAASGGMYVNHGCGHFVSVRSELHALEPVIAHEMTHACLSHLSIPAWLNEGLAVNTENRLAPSGRPLFTPEEMHAKHRQFWGEDEIQQFWSGKSFLRNDDGNLLSYDLSRILVEHFAADWDSFRQFANEADLADAGEEAALRHLGIDLGHAVCALLEQPHHPGWDPDPASWQEPPEKGAF